MKAYFFLVLCLLSGSAFSQEPRVIHVYVALCDNDNQGIVPVPASLGNGQDPGRNLYWGAAYGVKTFFKKSKYWHLQETLTDPVSPILERCVFRHSTQNILLVADAYDGAHIQATTEDFLWAASGWADSLCFEGEALPPEQLSVYVGHNGLMDFYMDEYPPARDSTEREVIMLGCITQSYFTPALQMAGAYPLVWTTGLMAPEAYTLEAVLNAWATGQSRAEMREAAAAAYHQYQKCGLKGARNLLVTGF